MNKAQLAGNLAVSLTLGAWSKEVLAVTLESRLPAPLRRLANAISAKLVAEVAGAYAPDPEVVKAALLNDTQFDRIFRFCDRRGLWPDPDLSGPVMAPTQAFARLDLPQIPTVNELAQWLFLPVERLTYLADLHNRHENHGETAINHYHYVLTPKKTGGRRVIEAPKQQLKAVQRQILCGILDKVPIYADAFGFAKGRSCLDGANRHVGEEVVVCFDLKDFFPSIRHARVLGFFRCLGYPLAVARYLTALCTSVTPERVLRQMTAADRPPYRFAHLPQGAPTSPSLANHTAFTLDSRLSALARSIHANYSRYANDLAFSGDRPVAARLLYAVQTIVQDEGFCLNPAKTRIQSDTTRQQVTGLVVNRHLNVSRETFDELKAIIHACSKPEDTRLNDPAFVASLVGMLDWVEQVNPHRGMKLKRALASTLNRQHS